MSKKFYEIKEAALEGKTICICRVSSGSYYSYEKVIFVKQLQSGKLVFKTQSGVRFQVKCEYGNYSLCGKASECFLKFDGELSSNAYENVVL